MNDKLIKFLSFFIPNSMLRKKFRSIIDPEYLYLNKNIIDEIELLKSFTSYSQFGEDKVLIPVLCYLFDKGIANISYLDIGSNAPDFDNNTYFFYKRNGNGVLVEPNPVFADITKMIRPRDIFINAGITFDEKKEALYYDFGENATGWNTFSKQRADEVIAEGHHLKQILNLPLIHINEILDRYFSSKELDILSIDVEGLDLEIIKSINFNKYRPKIICVEANKEDLIYACDNQTIKFMISQKYVLVADTFVNFIFADTTQIIPRANYTIKYNYNCPDAV